MDRTQTGVDQSQPREISRQREFTSQLQFIRPSIALFGEKPTSPAEMEQAVSGQESVGL